MKNLLLAFGILLIVSCSDSDAPDVSGIKVDLATQRFEQDFFSMDTNNIMPELNRLGQKYPVFLGDFLYNILGLPAISDTSLQVQAAIRQFISDYRPVKDSANKVFAKFSDVEEDVKAGLQYVRYYFPNYQLPNKLISFIGPMDAYFEGSLGGYGDAITSDAMAVGLQLHLGSNFSLYKSQMGQALYPDYISRRFTPETIPVNCMKNIIDDLFPDNSTSRSLVEQMVEKGKRIYVLDKVLPHTPDTLILGYTKSQLEGCYKNEGLIWNFFLRNSLLLNNDPGMIKSYVSEGPNTPEFGEGAPGNIGLFVGWQIVKQYMDKNEKLALADLMKKDAKAVFDESKYKPR